MGIGRRSLVPFHLINEAGAILAAALFIREPGVVAKCFSCLTIRSEFHAQKDFRALKVSCNGVFPGKPGRSPHFPRNVSGGGPISGGNLFEEGTG